MCSFCSLHLSLSIPWSSFWVTSQRSTLILSNPAWHLFVSRVWETLFLSFSETFLIIKITQTYPWPFPRESVSVGLERELKRLFSNIPGDFNFHNVWKHPHGLFNYIPVKGHFSSLNFFVLQIMLQCASLYLLPSACVFSEVDTEKWNWWVIGYMHFNIILGTAKLPPDVARAVFGPITVSIFFFFIY